MPSNKDPQEIDSFLTPRLAILRQHYRKGLAPDLVNLSGTEILRRVQGVPGFDRSLEVARLRVFLADVLVASGLNSDTLLQARLNTESARETIARVPRISQRTIDLFVHSSLVESVVYKATGNIDAAMMALERNTKFVANEFDGTSIDTVPLYRQVVLMRQSEKDFFEMAISARRYRGSNPIEYYATLKRVFEFLLNRHQLEHADRLYVEFRHAYARVANKLPTVAQVSFVKNVGHYFALRGLRERARRLLVRALYVAEKLQLHGQRRQLFELLHETDSGKGVLLTFEV